MTPLPSSQNRRNRRAPMAEINVTPMVDVMLVLLIIFMVTAPLLIAGVPIKLPDARAKALDQAAEPIQVSIGTDGQIFLGDEAITAADLPTRLTPLAPVNGEEASQVYLRADAGLDYGTVMRVMGELNRAGLNRVALVTVQPAAQPDGQLVGPPGEPR